MDEKLKRLEEERIKLMREARAELDAATESGTPLSGEAEERFDKKMARADEIVKLKEQIRAFSPVAQWMDEPEPALVKPDPAETRSTTPPDIRGQEYKTSFWEYYRRGKNVLDAHQLRALQIGTDSEGGYVAPDETIRTLIQKLNEQDIMRQLGTVFRTSSGTSTIPIVSQHGTAAWVGEEAAYTPSDEVFGIKQLGAFKAGTAMLVSEELLNDAFFDLESYVVNEFARRVGKLTEAAFVAGTGTTQPRGVVLDATAGPAAASASAITADEILGLHHSLPRPYRTSASYLMHDSTVLAIRKLKASDNQYIWQPGLTSGEPDRLLGRPLFTSEFMPTIAASAKVVAFGDYSYYRIADRQGPVFQRLNELYAMSGQVGFRGFMRTDGVLVLNDAVRTMAMGS